MGRRSQLVLLLALLLPAGHAVAADAVDGAIDLRVPEGASLAESVEPLLLAAAAARVPAPDRFEAVALRVSGGADLHGGVRLLPLNIDGPSRAGVVRMHYRVLAAGRPAGELRATVRGIVRGPSLVARTTLTRGEPIAADDVVVEQIDRTRLDGPALREPADVAGLVPGRTLGAGLALTASALRPAPAVRMGDVVDLQVRRGVLTVTTTARVLRDGATGETIPVANAASGARLTARVTVDGTLVAVRAAHGRR